MTSLVVKRGLYQWVGTLGIKPLIPRASQIGFVGFVQDKRVCLYYLKYIEVSSNGDFFVLRNCFCASV